MVYNLLYIKHAHLSLKRRNCLLNLVDWIEILVPGAGCVVWDLEHSWIAEQCECISIFGLLGRCTGVF